MSGVISSCTLDPQFCNFLSRQVQKADGKLDMIAWQIDAFEKEFEDPDSEVRLHWNNFYESKTPNYTSITFCFLFC